MPNFCILRTEKLKTMGNIAGSASHTFRSQPTPNANPALTPNNSHFYANDKDDVMANYYERLEEIGNIRKNAVLGIEYLITASPEFFEESSKEKINKYFDDAKKWLEEKHGKENVMYVGIQVDETSPHLVAYVVPVDSKGKLNASAYLDGRKMLSDMQTDFAEQVGKPSNLERGLEGSKASHVPIAEFYGAINSPIPEVKTRIPVVAAPTVMEKVLELAGVETEHSKAVEAAAEARKMRDKEKDERQKILESKAQFAVIAERSRDKKADQLSALRVTADEVRAIPLEDVLKRLGCTQDQADKNNWKTAAGRITVTGFKFFNHDLDKGGGGAIDLVMQIEGFNYKETVSWLGGNASREAVMGAVVAKARADAETALEGPKKRLAPPAKVVENWPRVKDYLVKIRSIKESFIDTLHDAGRLYADRFSNAVFVTRDGASCQLRGTTEKPFHGIRGKSKTWVWPHPEDSEKKKFICVESAIDAISYAEINGFNPGDRIISFGGSAGEELRKVAAHVKEVGGKIIAAFDRDAEGDRMAKVLKDTGVEYERKEPIKKDWNADLQEMKYKEMQEKTLEANKKIIPKI